MIDDQQMARYLLSPERSIQGFVNRVAELEAALLEAIEWIEADPICSADTDVAQSLRKALGK